MSDFVLKTDGTPGVTSVSNLFLDYYMPGANGEYVKVYLYLLRALNCPDISLSVAGLADVMDKTESDILRALKYWEKQGILSLECDDANTLQGIYLCTIPDPVAKKSEANATVSLRQEKEAPAPKSYSPEELNAFAQQSECRQLLFVCNQYLGKTLSPSEIETILYFYDQLHFSADRISGRVLCLQGQQKYPLYPHGRACMGGGRHLYGGAGEGTYHHLPEKYLCHHEGLRHQ